MSTVKIGSRCLVWVVSEEKVSKDWNLTKTKATLRAGWRSKSGSLGLTIAIERES